MNQLYLSVTSDSFKLFNKIEIMNYTYLYGYLISSSLNSSFHKVKLQVFHNIVENPFYSLKDKEDFIETFCQIQKIHTAFSKFSKIWQYKHSKIYNTEDLLMSPISPNEKNTITLFENKTRYIFRIRELIQTCNNYLSNTCYFFNDPISCKNPYTNIPFHKANLYNIYFAVKSSSYVMPVLLHMFFMSNFDLNTYSNNNIEIIREHYLETYSNTLTSKQIYEDINDMLYEYRMYDIVIDEEFPSSRLYILMKPYLNLFYKSKYSSNEIIKRNAHIELHKLLIDLYRHNPKFGRKYIYREQTLIGTKLKIKQKKKFNDSMPNLYKKKPINDFLINHLHKKTPWQISIRRLNTVVLRNENRTNSSNEDTETELDNDDENENPQFNNQDTDEDRDEDEDEDGDEDEDRDEDEDSDNENQPVVEEEDKDSDTVDEDESDEELEEGEISTR